ncbi:MAG: hypothetical protein ACU84J_01435 [Gammaproteobacteria bacterium]
MKLLLQYLGLCWFRNDPSNLMPSKTFVSNVIVFYLVSGIIVEGLIADFADGTLEVLGRTVMAFTTIATLLFILRKFWFFKQLFTAIFVCENFIMTLAIGLEILDVWMVMNHLEYQEEISIALATVLVIWYVSVVGYILRQMLKFNMGYSVVSAFAYFVLTYGVPMLFMDM